MDLIFQHDCQNRKSLQKCLQWSYQKGMAVKYCNADKPERNDGVGFYDFVL